MNKILLSLLLIVLATSGCGVVESPISDVSSIKVRTESKYKVDLFNQNAKKLIYSKEYSNSGKLLKQTEYFENGKIKSISQFTYEENKAYETHLIYDEFGNLKSTIKTISLFDESGKIKEKQVVSSEGKLVSKEIYFYDTKGNLLKKVSQDLLLGTEQLTEYSYRYDRGSLVERTVSEKNPYGSNVFRDSINYKQNEKALEITNYNENGEVQNIKTYFYNNYGLVSVEIEADKNGNILKKYIYQYEYF
jgi:antitoxin component YwqK of YwqJK toxin-antitoxin module